MKGFNKWLLLVLALVLALAVGLTGCGANDSADVDVPDDAPELTVLTVGASVTPHAEILAELKDELAAEGIELKIVEFTDYVTPNTALDSGELDANFFQHVPYLDNFNEENGTDLVSVFPVHFEPLTIYAGKSDDLSNIADGAKVAIPSDPTNGARSLLLLEAEGLITLGDDLGMTATPQDIVENPHNIEIVEAEAAAVPRLLDDVDFAVINGNNALAGDVDPARALASESADSEAADLYANVIVVKAGNENDAAIQKLVNALKSETLRSWILERYEGIVVPVF